MARSACKAAQNAQALTSGDACRNNMKALEFDMSSSDWDRLPEAFREDIVERAIKADEAYVECCEEFCDTYERILDEIDKATRRLSDARE